MRCLPSVILALWLCLLAAPASGVSGSDASGSGAPVPGGGMPLSGASASGTAKAADVSGDAVSAADTPASGVAASASGGGGVASGDAASGAAEVSAPPTVPAPSFVPSPIPDAPPPGWTEEQLADLRSLELQLRHQDIEPLPPPGEPEMYYDITLTTQDLNASGKERPLCVKRVWVKTDLGAMGQRCGTGQCLGYEFFFLRTRILSIPKELRIRSAVMDVAPYREAPQSAVLRGLDAMPMLRAVPLPPVTLTMSGRPLPTMPAAIAPLTKKKPWPSKYRVHLADAFTDSKAPHWRCYSYSIMQIPQGAEGFSGFHVRTNIGDYKRMDRGIGLYAVLCAPEAVDNIDIQHSTFWMGPDMRKLQRMNGGPLLVDDGFVPLPFVTDKGPLPPPAGGMYPPRPRNFTLGDPEE